MFDTTDQEPLKAGTIGELAQKLFLDQDKLKQTVSNFNTAIKDQPLDLLKLDGKATTGLAVNKSIWANPITTPLYHGYSLTSHLTLTYGGLKTDLESRVLAHNGAPIPGLYCAGELSGLFYNEYPPATSVLRSLTFDRLSGIAAAREL